MSAERVTEAIDAALMLMDPLVPYSVCLAALTLIETVARSDQRARDFPTNNDAEDDRA